MSAPEPGTPLRVANASGFYGDRFAAVHEMLSGGRIDVLTGDYLAELTMLILGRDRLKNPGGGYAKTFLRQMETALGQALDLGVTVVANAGGLNPAGLAAELRDLARRLGLSVRVAHVEGDDLLPRAEELGLGRPLTANAYLGAWGIAECVRAGADVVVTGRVTDAALLLGPAAAHFGWTPEDYDALAGGVVAGHVIECGAQATGGNYSFFTEVAGVEHPGFPIAEMHADGSCVITKHKGTGGEVSTGTVTAQLLYEITGARYANPDVTARFDTIRLVPDGPDRVAISGVRGEPPPPEAKVGLNTLGGYRNETTFVLTGLDIEAKAALVRRQLEAALGADGPADVRWTLARTDRPDAATEETASALLHCEVKDTDADKVGRAFSGSAVELALAGYPGFHVSAPPARAAPYGVFTHEFVPAAALGHVAVLADGTRRVIAPPGETRPLRPEPEPAAPVPSAGTSPDLSPRTGPLGLFAGARSGDKGGSANVGLWVRTESAWQWLVREMTVERFRELLPETAGFAVTRHTFSNLRALNFVVEGLLGEGAAAKARFDPQAKALGEWLRSRCVEAPHQVFEDEVPRDDGGMP